MKIGFFDDLTIRYTPQTPYERPLGGTQSAVAYLSAALAARGHHVTLINRAEHPGVYLGVVVPGPGAGRNEVINSFDVMVVASRPLSAAFRQGGVSIPLVCWQHNYIDAPGADSFASAEERAGWTAVAFVSDDQRRAFQDSYGLDGVVLRNAISPSASTNPLSPDCFLDRGGDPVLIYASAPGRGLDIVLAGFAALREQLPQVRLRICSDAGIYHISPENDEYSALYALARAMDGVEFVGSVAQPALNTLFADSDFLAYPATFVETSCIVAMEAAAAGCTFTGPDLGALRETLAGFGVFMPYNRHRGGLSRDYAALVVETVRAARADPAAFKARRTAQSAWFRESHTWVKRADEWEAWLGGLIRQRA